MNHKENKHNYVTIIESKKDAIDFLKIKSSKSYIITFSQEAEYILKYKNNIKTTSIWEIFNYDYKKFEEDSFDTLRKYFSCISKNNLFFNVSNSFFYNQFFMDSFLCEMIAKYLVAFFPKSKFIFINKNYKSKHKILTGKYKYNSIFKFYLLFYLSKSDYKKNRLNFFNRIYFSKYFLYINVLINTLKFLLTCFFNIFAFKINNIDKTIKKNNYEFITNSWGRDLSRFINFSEFNNLCLDSKINILNIIWNRNKITKDSKFKENNIYLDTDFEGIKISNFKFYERLNIFLKIFKETLNFISFKKLIKNIDIFNYNIYLNYPYLIKINHVNELFSKKLDCSKDYKTFISSYTDFPPLLSINYYMHKFTNVSLYPHAPNLYNLKNSFNNFHTLLMHSDTKDETIFNNSINFKEIKYFSIGNNYIKKNLISSSKSIDKKNLNIVIATRSNGGRWTTPLFDFDTYLVNLIELCNYLNSKEYNVIIKSHPNGDFFDLYDLLSSDFKFINHVKVGWKERNLNLSEICDLMICYSDVPSLFTWAIAEKIPAMVYDCSFNEKFRENKYYNIPSELIYNNFIALKENIEKLILNKAYLNSYLEIENDALSKYSKINPEKNLLNYILQKK